MTIEEFLIENASAVFGLVGAFGAALIAFPAAWVLSKRNFDLQLWNKLIDRRIDAHEKLIEVAMQLRTMISTAEVSESGEVFRYPQILHSKDVFENWIHDMVNSNSIGSTWLTTEAKHESHFLQDYLITIHTNLVDTPSENYPKIGNLIRQDFIDLSSALEKVAHRFFSKDVRKLKLGDPHEWHKLPLETTEKRMAETAFYTQVDAINKLRG